MKRVLVNPMVLAVLGLMGCTAEAPPPAPEFGQGDPSRMVVLLPSPFLAGYEQDLHGEYF